MIRRFFVWLSRIGNCKGFGIQSPWAYSFVCDVINERHPYYAYDSLENRYKDKSLIERKLGRLILRIANCLQPQLTVCFGEQADMYGDYANAGCCKSRTLDNLSEAINIAGEAGMKRMLWIVSDIEVFRNFGDANGILDDGSVLVLMNIYRDSQTKQMWRELINRNHYIAFDLYYCGIVFRDDKRYGESFKVNF